METESHFTQFTVEFSDCDPAQIVFYPNFFRWRTGDRRARMKLQLST